MKIKRVSGLLWMLLAVCSASAQSYTTPEEIVSVMKKVADWQTSAYDKSHSPDTNWENGALFVGMSHWAALSSRLQGDDTYYKWLYQIGQRCQWQPGPRMYHADDITICQMYLELYLKYQKPQMTYPTIARTDFIESHPSAGSLDFRLHKPDLFNRWSWCDALFMAPAVYLRLYLLTGDKKYIRFMDREYKATTDYLYDRTEHLFFRDASYFGKQEANGTKVFWGRGNGWVVAGLAEILKLMPQSNRYRNYYVKLYRALAARLVRIQQPDGYWHASLLDPASYPSPETSATGFITYALAYGVRSGLLDRATYLPAVERGWKAMTDAVFPDGMLGYVQPIGADPQKVTRSMTAVYGVGAFLSLGCEMYQLAGGK